MRIVVLDGHTLNPGDLSWKELEQMGELIVYDRTSIHEVSARMIDAEIVLTNKTTINEEAMRQAAALRYIGVIATGFNVVAVEAARRRGITVTNAPAYGTDSVAQHTFALILELMSHVGLHSASVHRGDWSAQPDFSYWHKPITELQGKTLAIVGLGRIGKAVARIALAFGMKVIAHHTHPERDRMEGVQFVDWEECLSRADILTLHCPLTSTNQGMINKSSLVKMKPTSYLINVSRGPLVVESDLAEGLRNNVIAGAGLDVLCQEPPEPTHAFFGLSNCILTPHVAWASRSARERLMRIVVDNVRAYLEGHPRNVVSQTTDPIPPDPPLR